VETKTQIELGCVSFKPTEGLARGTGRGTREDVGRGVGGGRGEHEREKKGKIGSEY